MAFPPNYRQERNNRERAKQRKALEKQAKREERSALRRADEPSPAPESGPGADEAQSR